MSAAGCQTLTVLSAKGISNLGHQDLEDNQSSTRLSLSDKENRGAVRSRSSGGPRTRKAQSSRALLPRPPALRPLPAHTQHPAAFTLSDYENLLTC